MGRGTGTAPRVLLAALADHDAQRLRDAAAGEWVSIAARDLLLAAARDWC